MSDKILVTGPDGFVGACLCRRLLKDGFAVRGAQLAAAPLPDGCESVVVGDLAAATNWNEAMAGVARVVHLAARVHIMRDQASDPLREFRGVNVEGTKAVALAAARAGVKRFVFVSTIKVLGESSAGRPFSATDPAAPGDPYAVSKWEAETWLAGHATATGMELTIVRPPLVYGPGVRANFLRLMKAVQRGVPMPFGRVRNRRSLVGVHNLVDLLARCVSHPQAAHEIFHVSDGEDLSTADLVRHLAAALGRPARLLPIPEGWMKLAGSLLGKRKEVDRLLGSLEVDISKTKKLIGWNPPVSVEEGLRETAEWYLNQ